MTPTKLILLQRPSWTRLNANNMLSQPKAFDDAAWTKGTGVTVSANAIVGPDGMLTADKIIETATTSAKIVQQTVTSTARAYQIPAKFKAAERSIAVIRVFDGAAATGYATYFNLATGAVGTNAAGNNASMRYLKDDWWLCTVIRTIGASAASLAQFGMAASDGTLSYAGDITKGIYCVDAEMFPL